MDLHGEGSGSTAATKAAPSAAEGGEKVDRPDNYEPPVQKAV